MSYRKKSGAVEMPLTAHHAALSADVVDIAHRDPFDKMLLAQAMLRDCMFMTCDKAIMGYGFPNLIDGRV